MACPKGGTRVSFFSAGIMLMNRSHLQVAASAFLFGLVPMVVKASSLSSVQLSVGRLFFAAMTLAMWRAFESIRSGVAKSKSDPPQPSSSHSQRLTFLFFGVLHGLTILASFAAIKLISTAVAALLLFAGSVYLAGLSILFLREPAEPLTLFALIFSVVGVVTLCWPAGGQTHGHFVGYMLGTLSGVLMAGVFLLGKYLVRRHDRTEMALVQQLIALPLVAPLLFFEPPFVWNWKNLGALAVLGIVCTAVPCLLLYTALRHTSGQKVGVLLMLELATPVLLSPFVFGEVPTLREMLGTAMVSTACVMALVKRVSWRW